MLRRRCDGAISEERNAKYASLLQRVWGVCEILGLWY